jgi:hypothetical protein
MTEDMNRKPEPEVVERPAAAPKPEMDELMKRMHLKDDCEIVPDALWRIDARIVKMLKAAGINQFGDLRKLKRSDVRNIRGLRSNDQILVEKYHDYLSAGPIQSMGELGIKPGIDLRTDEQKRADEQEKKNKKD